MIATIGTVMVSAGLPEEPTKEEVGIQFFDGTWDEALALSKKEGKPIFLDAYASWCGPCKVLKARVFTQSNVGDYYNANFINVKRDMERGEGKQLAKKYRVTAYPSLFFIASDGSVVKKAVGYHDPEKLISLGKSVLTADGV
ncbi:MAG TPA: thioredoxin [Flavobacteriales bacterium]|nr:thioredoxin family protein [Flavobacteriales bacterium]HAW19805.1 thioredoxin [Flavobacteriales bacterium]